MLVGEGYRSKPQLELPTPDAPLAADPGWDIHYETEESHKLTIQTDCLTHLKVLYMTYEM